MSLAATETPEERKARAVASVRRWREKNPERAKELNRAGVRRYYYRNKAALNERRRLNYRKARGVPADWPKGKHFNLRTGEKAA